MFNEETRKALEILKNSERSFGNLHRIYENYELACKLVNGIEEELYLEGINKDNVINKAREEVIREAENFISTNVDYLKEQGRLCEFEREGNINRVAIYGGQNKGVIAEGEAKCSKKDVYNYFIGNAIALARALNLEFSYFTDTIQPTINKGQIVKTSYGDIVEVLRVGEYRSLTYYEYNNGGMIRGYIKDTVILEDSLAIYE